MRGCAVAGYCCAQQQILGAAYNSVAASFGMPGSMFLNGCS